MEWKHWQSVSFGERSQLPSCSGIYVVADGKDFVWYVGQAVDLKNRWVGKNHHRYPQLIRSHRQLGHRIYWRSVLVSELVERERYYINLFQPELNGCKVKTYLPKQPQVQREIKRLFKVLNRTTRLFPVVRSPVAGEYEDENGVRCILTIINVNDLEILGNSASKRHSSEVRKAWIDVQSNCGKSEAIHDSRYVLTYLLAPQRFEFVEGWEILDHLEQNPTAYEQFVGVAKFWGVEVKVLKDLSLLEKLSIKEVYEFTIEGKTVLKDIAYLNYRKPLLKPLQCDYPG